MQCLRIVLNCLTHTPIESLQSYGVFWGGHCGLQNNTQNFVPKRGILEMSFSSRSFFSHSYRLSFGWRDCPSQWQMDIAGLSRLNDLGWKRTSGALQSDLALKAGFGSSARLPRTLSGWVLSISKDGDFHVSGQISGGFQLALFLPSSCVILLASRPGIYQCLVWVRQ